VQRADVRVVQCRGGARFLFEAAATVGMGREIRRKHFDRDRATQTGVAGLVDLPHAAGADERLDLVRPEKRARFQWRRAWSPPGRWEKCLARRPASQQRLDLAP